jgi:uncharacterized RDD family membrane protein YckC
MTTLTRSNVAEQYVQKVMGLIHAPEADRQRIEADLKAHLQEGMEEGEDMTALVERMGDPREVAAGFMAEIPLVYAGFWPRVAAFLVDFVLMLVIAGLFGGLFLLLNPLVPAHPATLWENIWGGGLILLLVISANAAIAMILAYFPLLEARFGQTLGKRLLHLRVCAENGLPVGAWQAVLRRLSFYFEIFPIDALFVFFNPKKQRGFDILARTVVVKD